MANNPFYYNLPTRPADFLGRWPLVEEIVADLSRPRPDSWAIIGGRRFGKSSLLKAIESRLLERLSQTGPGERHIFPLVVDLKSSQMRNERSVYERIMRLLHRALRRQRRTLELDPAQLPLHELATDAAEEISYYQFEESLFDLTLYFEDHRGPLRLVLLLDEVEATTRFEWSETMFNQLRAMIYDGDLADSVKLVLTGAANVTRVRHAGSPLLNAVKIEHLAVLPEADIHRLIDRGGEIPAAGRAAIIAQSGGHPFLAQYLLHHLWQEGLTHVTPAAVEQAARQMQRQRAADLEGWWQTIAADGQQAYTILAEAGDWLDERAIMAQVHIEQGLSALCYHGLVKRDSGGRRYRIGSQLFRDWQSQQQQAISGEDETDLLAEKASLRRQLIKYRQTLAWLQEQKAQYGLQTPPHVLHGIDDARTNIERIEARLTEIDRRLGG